MSEQVSIAVNINEKDLEKLRILTRASKNSVGDEIRKAIGEHIRNNQDKIGSLVIFPKGNQRRK